MPSYRSRLIQGALRELKGVLQSTATIETRRQQFDESARIGIRIPREVVINPLRIKDIPAVWINPLNLDTQKIILYLHGGGYVIGSITTHRGLASRIALSAHARVLLIEYRLAPEQPFPAALEDALFAYHWLLENGAELKHVAIGGDSAGGGLSLATALSLAEKRIPLPAALFLLSPWTDLTFSGDSVISRAARDPLLTASPERNETTYAGDFPLAYPLISPLFADLHGLPPTLIQVGSEEILFDDSYRLEKQLTSSGVINQLEVWDGMWHVFQGFAPLIPEAQHAISRIGKFLDQHL